MGKIKDKNLYKCFSKQLNELNNSILDLFKNADYNDKLKLINGLCNILITSKYVDIHVSKEPFKKM